MPGAAPRHCCSSQLHFHRAGGGAAAAATSLHRLFAYDPTAPSQLLGKWRISSQLDSKLQPLRLGVVEDPIGKTVGRITVQEGDGLSGANKAMLEARHYICSSEGSRAAAAETAGGVVPSERAEIQIRSDRTTGASDLVKFRELVWYRFSLLATGRRTFRSRDGSSAAPSFKIEARPLGEHVRFFALAHDGISAIWKLQIAAAEAHATGYPGSARVIMQIVEAAEQPWLRTARDCSFADMIAALR